MQRAANRLRIQFQRRFWSHLVKSCIILYVVAKDTRGGESSPRLRPGATGAARYRKIGPTIDRLWDWTPTKDTRKEYGKNHIKKRSADLL